MTTQEAKTKFAKDALATPTASGLGCRAYSRTSGETLFTIEYAEIPSKIELAMGVSEMIANTEIPRCLEDIIIRIVETCVTHKLA